MQRIKSKKIYEASCKWIPGGVNSPVRAFRSMGIPPLIVKKGKEDLIWDEDGHSYIDYCGSWGALILGHSHPKVVKAARKQMGLGSSFGISTKVEKEIAAFIGKKLPSIEKIRFVSSGTEATMSALRLARGYTGKAKIVKFAGNYHGHHDSLLVQAGSGLFHVNSQASSKGVPEEMVKSTLVLPYNDIEAAEKHISNDVAAVILEPVAGNMGVVPASPEFIAALREITRKQGAVLIFDEVISGFRVAFGGAQSVYNVIPDLTCFGKIIGAGFPTAAFGGKKEIMDHLAPLGEVYQAGTLSGNPVAMHAGLAALKEISQPGFYEELQAKTDRLLLPIEEVLRKTGKGCLQRQGSMFTLFWGPKQVTCKEDLKQVDEATFKRFFLYLLAQGIYIPPLQYEASFVSIAHTDEHLDKTRDAICQFLA